jgi:UPF0755 protein
MSQQDQNSKSQNQQKKHIKAGANWWLRSFLIITLITGLAVGYAYLQFKQFVESPISTQTEAVIIHIKPGSSVHKVARQLHAKGLLKQPKWFAWYVQYQKKQNLIKAGEFYIQPQWNIDQLIAGLANAKDVQYPATIIAGQTIQQAIQRIQGLPKLKIELDINDIAGLQNLLGVEEGDRKVDDRYPYATIEGRILPETYHYQLGDSDKDILLRAYKATNKVLDQAWNNRDKKLPYKTPYEALIMASIVEKETGHAPERPLIAGVFVRRLNKGMRLQTDPTVIYGIGKDYDGNIRKRDLLAKTPYNTYTINRLPPTPIALPSRDAIEATLNPAKTKALYFVAKGDGEHHFSNTLKEHNDAVRKYLLNKK